MEWLLRLSARIDTARFLSGKIGKCTVSNAKASVFHFFTHPFKLISKSLIFSAFEPLLKDVFCITKCFQYVCFDLDLISFLVLTDKRLSLVLQLQGAHDAMISWGQVVKKSLRVGQKVGWIREPGSGARTESVKAHDISENHNKDYNLVLLFY